MSLKIFECVEYFLNDQNGITGYQIWPKLKKPEFENNPVPLPQMEQGIFLDTYGNPKWYLIENEIVPSEDNPDAKQIAIQNLNNLSQFGIIKRLISGIESKNNPDYIELCNWIIDAEI